MSIELIKYPARSVSINQNQILSITETTATPETVFNGIRFVDNDGNLQTGTAYGITTITRNSDSVILSELISNQLLDLTQQEHLSNLQIDEFARIDADVLQEWQIILKTDDEIPTISLPSGIKWSVAEPVYEKNKTYWLSFIQLGEQYLGIWTVIDNE